MSTYLLAAVVSVHPTIPDIVTFIIAALVVIGGALGVIFNSNPVHAALMLVATLFGIAVLFVEENAQFLAAVQVIVYTGAIVVLILFVIMLLGVDRREEVIADTFRGQQYYAVFMGILILAEVLLLARSNSWITGAKSATKPLSSSTSNVAQLGQSLFTTYLIPFEATSALLIVAIIGAVVLARQPRKNQSDGLDNGETSNSEENDPGVNPASAGIGDDGEDTSANSENITAAKNEAKNEEGKKVSDAENELGVSR